MCEANAIQGNPVDGVKRPKNESAEVKTPAIARYQARALLAAPDASTLGGMRDRAVLAMLLYHGLRRDELCALHLVDLQERRGVCSLRVHGKGGKIRYVPLHPAAAGTIALYLEAAGHGADKAAPLFQPVNNNSRGAGRAITPGRVYQMLAKYAADAGVEVDGFGPHALRATTATTASAEDPYCSHVFLFRGRRGDMLKVL
jgi:integrase/recombinase XerD